MADLSVTAANVRPKASATISTVDAGETITAGQPVYKKVSDSKYYRADANVGSEEAAASGIAITNADANEKLIILSKGGIDPGATVVIGETYIVSATVGGIAPIGDLAASSYVTHLGIGKAADEITVGIVASGVQRA